MWAYKGFRRDLTCTLGKGIFQYEEDKWYEEAEAKCVSTGFHCAENPLDCLTYYPDMEKSVYYIVQAEGDINEDGTDTKISCTRMRLHKRLSMEEFVTHALKYLCEHPRLQMNGYVKKEKGEARKRFAIVRGKNPIAKGAAGSILAFAQEERESCEIEELGLYIVGQDGIEPEQWYNIHGEKVEK